MIVLPRDLASRPAPGRPAQVFGAEVADRFLPWWVGGVHLRYGYGTAVAG